MADLFVNSCAAAGSHHSLAVVWAKEAEVAITVAKGQPPPLRVGPGFSVYERRRDANGREIEEFITVIPAPEPILYAVTDAQFNTWKGKRLIGRPMRLEER